MFGPLFLGFTLVFLALPPAWSQVVRDDMWVTNGSVWASVIHGNILYIGGTFTRVGPATGCGIPFDAASGTPISGFPRVIGRIASVISDGAGGWFIGGQFSSVGGYTRANLAHIRADNTVSAWNPGTTGSVAALALSGGIVYVGGRFSGTGSIGGETRSRLAAVDATSGVVTEWQPDPNGNVGTLATGGNRLYVGGSFTTIAGEGRDRLAAFDLGTGSVTPWDPGADDQVFDIEIGSGEVYACGWFANVGGQPRYYLAALDSITGAATAWNPDPDNLVFALATSGDTVFAGGDFTLIGGGSRNHIVALDRETGAALPWNPNANQRVHALQVSGNTLYAGGLFTSIGGVPRNYLAALDVDTGNATAWNPDVNNVVSALAKNGSVLYVGGALTSYGGATRNHIAALDLSTGAVTAWNPNADNWVASLAVEGSTVWAGGYFDQIGGQYRCRIAALNATTGNATSWGGSCVPGTGSRVLSLAVADGRVYKPVGTAQFAQPGIAALDASTGQLVWQTPANNETFALAVGDGRVYAGGAFSTMGGQPHDCLAALDAATGSVIESWNPGEVSGIDNYVESLVLDPGRALYVGGPFASVGGQSRVGIAAVDAATGDLLPWTMNTNAGLRALALNQATLYIGGLFTTVGAQARRFFAAIDLNTNAVTPLDPSPDWVVETISAGSGHLCVGGGFLGMSGLPQAFVAVLAPVPVSVPEHASRSADFLMTPISTDRDRIEIRYVLGTPASSVLLSIYDAHGRQLRSFPDLATYRGTHVVLWNGRRDSGTRLARGIYFVLLQAGERSASRKLVVLGD